MMFRVAVAVGLIRSYGSLTVDDSGHWARPHRRLHGLEKADAPVLTTEEGCGPR